MIGSNPYREAIDAFGLQHQVDKCIEEMSELTKELLKTGTERRTWTTSQKRLRMC